MTEKNEKKWEKTQKCKMKFVLEKKNQLEISIEDISKQSKSFNQLKWN